MDEGLGYWKEQLARIPERLELPTDRSRRAVQTFEAEACHVMLSAEQAAKLKQVSRENQTTLYMTLLAAFGVLLARYSGQDDIVVGSPIANRQEEQLEELIGFFVNTLAMRLRLTPAMSLRELLAQVRQTALEAYRYQDIPFERLVEELSPQRSLNTTPVFQVGFALQNVPFVDQKLEGLEIELVNTRELTIRFDIDLTIHERQGKIGFFWLFKQGLFDRWRIEQMARHYLRVLEGMVADIDQALRRVDILEPKERRRILQQSTGIEHQVPELSIPDLFRIQAQKSPYRIAVAIGDQRLTYADLNERANQLAHYLIALGVRQEERVVLCVNRGEEILVGLLGI